MINNDPNNPDPAIAPDDRDTREMGPAERPHSTTKTATAKAPDAEEDDSPDFDGRTYNAKKDKKRLSTQMAAVRNVMSDGLPHTLKGLVADLAVRGIRASEAGVSARIRDLRKKKFGGQTVMRRRSGDPTSGLHEYVLVKVTEETEHGEKWETK